MEAAKNREKEARKAAIRQASEQSLCVTMDDDSSDSGSEEDCNNRKRKKQGQQKMAARMAAIRQASQRNMPLSNSNRSLNSSTGSLSSLNSTSAASTSDKDLRQKQAEKERRKAAIRQHSQRSLGSLGRADSARSVDSRKPAAVTSLTNLKMAPPVTHGEASVKKAPASAASAAKLTPDQIKEQEKQRRKERLQSSHSNRSLSPLPRPAGLKKAPPTTQDPQDPTTIKEQEKQRRKERLEYHSRQNSARSLASGRSISPGPVNANANRMKTQAERDAESKRRAAPSTGVAMAPGAVFVAKPAPTHGKAARAPDPLTGLASCQAVEGNLERLDALAKQRAASRGGGGATGGVHVPVGAFSVPNEPNTPSQQIEAAFQELDSGSAKEVTHQGSKPGAVPTQQPSTRDMDKSDQRLLEPETTPFTSFHESVLSEIQPVPEPDPEEALVPGAFCSAHPEGNPASFVLSAHDSIVQDLEAPDPLLEEYFNHDANHDGAAAGGGGGGGLIEATLVEDAVEATIATAYVADDVEIRKQSAAETARVKQWRIIVCLALLATAVAVTVSTYKILVAQEHENFQNVVGIITVGLGLLVLSWMQQLLTCYFFCIVVLSICSHGWRCRGRATEQSKGLSSLVQGHGIRGCRGYR